MRNDKLKLLAPFIGHWTTEGKTEDGNLIKGTDIYEWIEGAFFLMHKVNVQIDDEKISNLEIIHYDDMDDVFRAQSFGSDGAITISSMKIFDDIILIFGDNERFQGNFKGNQITGVWERYVNNQWQPWMNIQLTK
ncbi:hypothetical protein [Pedobacter agri]|uniref:hypothetical protein n=1 Tax=Pedobacter agri TaxID=454586 RepID=UPI0029309A1B|nr:hypothetical protein [Pedobacter agri]